MPERDFDLMGRSIIDRPRYDTEHGKVPPANKYGTLELPEPNSVKLIRRIRSFLNLVQLRFSDLTVQDEVDKSEETKEFCIATGQRNLAFSLAYADSYNFTIPIDLLDKAQTAVKRHRAVADEFYVGSK